MYSCMYIFMCSISWYPANNNCDSARKMLHLQLARGVSWGKKECFRDFEALTGATGASVTL